LHKRRRAQEHGTIYGPVVLMAFASGTTVGCSAARLAVLVALGRRSTLL